MLSVSPLCRRQRPEDEPLTVVAGAIAHVDSLVASYCQVGARPNPATILMMIAAILEDPKLREAAGIDHPADGRA